MLPASEMAPLQGRQVRMALRDPLSFHAVPRGRVDDPWRVAGYAFRRDCRQIDDTAGGTAGGTPTTFNAAI